MTIDLNLGNVPEAHFHTVAALMTKAFGVTGELEIINAGVGYVYERKEHLATDALGARRNTSYGSDRDDIVIQIAVRIDRESAEKIGVFDLERKLLREQLNYLMNDRAQAQATLEALDAQLANAQKRLGL